MNQEENILGTEKIGKLMRKFSIPCIISLLVNSLYNIVDQIFIGWKVGTLGNGATNVVFPLTMICLAFSLMFGDGSSAFLNLKLGQKKQEEASKGVINGIILSTIMAILICVLSIIFLPQILNVFGCTDVLRPYALDYGFIIVIGLPFMMIGTTLNSIIRADGNPKFAMTSMITGAVLNIILDYILMFVIPMGVKGAAIATIISQIVTAVLNITHLRKMKNVKITKKSLKLEGSICKNVSMLGISSFITQMSIVVVMAFENNLLGKYGASSKYGAEIPITVLGIVMKTLKTVLGLSLIISTIAFLLFQLIPDKLISLFGNGDDNYIEFACLAFRTYLMLCIFNGVQIPSGIFFQAIGKSVKSAVLSISRQIAFLIPSMVILGHLYGVTGVLSAGPVADGLAFVIAAILLIKEVRSLGKKANASSTLPDDTSTDNKLEKHTVITISREYGSGGRYIGRLVADKLGIKFYDRDLVENRIINRIY